MRVFETNGRISVNAIAGTNVVLLGLNASAEARSGLLGFTIEKKWGDHDYRPLRGGARAFENFDVEEGADSRTSPIQSMMWSDYTVRPGDTYGFRVIPVYGAPGDLQPGDPVELEITTENNDDGKHGVFFNRGVAGSQAYARKFSEHMKYYPTEVGFGDRKKIVSKPYIKPSDVPDRAAYEWLSRGLEEAMLAFQAQAVDETYAIRAAVYELTWQPALQGFADAIDRGADVKVIHHCKHQSSFVMGFDRGAVNTSTWEDGSQEDVIFKNRYGKKESHPDGIASAAIKAAGRLGVSNPDRFDVLKDMLIHRTNTTISHNKFMILLKDGKPVQVWTGSTNYTGGGIFGQSNVGHIVRDEAVAQQYLDYWHLIHDDPKSKDAKAGTARIQDDLVGPPTPGITCIFSPRDKAAMLDWYAEQMRTAKGSVFFTTAFTVADQILDVVDKDSTEADGPFQRYLLLEGNGGLLRDKIPAMRNSSQNSIAWGDVLRSRDEDAELHLQLETLTGLNDHVNFLHTKYMLIDPLGEDPLVVSGSANFSDNSTRKNDENILVIRGNTRVADIFLGEFMRLFNHFQSRNKRNAMSDAEFEAKAFLASDDRWTEAYYTTGTSEFNERLLFAGPGAQI